MHRSETGYVSACTGRTRMAVRRSAKRGSLSAITRARTVSTRSVPTKAPAPIPPHHPPGQGGRRRSSPTTPPRRSARAGGACEWRRAWLDGTVLNSSRNGSRFPESAFMRRSATRESADAESVMTDNARSSRSRRTATPAATPSERTLIGGDALAGRARAGPAGASSCRRPPRDHSRAGASSRG